MPTAHNIKQRVKALENFMRPQGRVLLHWLDSKSLSIEEFNIKHNVTSADKVICLNWQSNEQAPGYAEKYRG